MVKKMLAKDAADRPQAMSDVVRQIEDLLGVPASQFAGQAKVPQGFPIDFSGTPMIAWGQAIRAHTTVRAPSGTETHQAPPVPQTTASETEEGEVDGSSRTTLSHAASTVKDGLSPSMPPTRRTGLALGIGGIASILLLSGISVMARRSAIDVSLIEAPHPVAPMVQADANTREVLTERRFVSIDLEGAPRAVNVELDGEPVTLPVALPFGVTQHLFTLKAPGFKTEVLQVDASRDRTIVVNMQALAGPGQSTGRIRQDRVPLRPQRKLGRLEGQTPAIRKDNEGFMDI